MAFMVGNNCHSTEGGLVFIYHPNQGCFLASRVKRKTERRGL